MLYSGDANTDLLNLYEYIDELYSALGIIPVEVDVEAMKRVVTSMYRDFPFAIGISDASPFKKAAAFTAYFVSEKPIITNLPHTRVGDLATHQNAIVAFDISRDALEGAQIICPKRGHLVMSKRIKISLHYWMDLIVALSVSAKAHAHHISLIYEALTYNSNPDISYPRVI